MNVVHNHATHRLVTACVCGRTTSFPDSGLSQFDCPCGKVVTCDGSTVARFRLERAEDDDE
jgi:hypothetical protein